MYLVSFYSPKEKSGVTQTSLLVEKWLRENTSLSIAFICNGILEQKPENEHTIQNFGNLKLSDQKKKVNELKKHFDIVIFDASSQMTENCLKLLPIADRLFIMGEDDIKFAEVLSHMIAFNRLFNHSSRDLVNEIHNDGAYVFHDDDNHKIGFAGSKKDFEDVAKIIYNDFVLYKLHQIYIKENQELLAKAKKVPKDSLGIGIYELGIAFDKSMAFEKLVKLRAFVGQSYEDALEELFPILLKSSYDDLIRRLNNEIYVAQIGFGKK